jgi:type 2A phosphatase activator TIP41
MASGFLVLCRYFGRMDGKLVQLHDARYYHEFGTEIVLRDFETRKATTVELQRVCLVRQ